MIKIKIRDFEELAFVLSLNYSASCLYSGLLIREMIRELCEVKE